MRARQQLYLLPVLSVTGEELLGLSCRGGGSISRGQPDDGSPHRSWSRTIIRTVSGRGPDELLPLTCR